MNQQSEKEFCLCREIPEKCALNVYIVKTQVSDQKYIQLAQIHECLDPIVEPSHMCYELTKLGLLFTCPQPEPNCLRALDTGAIN